MASETNSRATPVPDQVQLALERTYLAHERTLMAWVRTATSLITFGFTLYKIFYYMHEQDPVRFPEAFGGTRTFGILLIGIGVLLLVLATWQHRQMVRQLRTHYVAAPFSLSFVMAILIASLGVFGFVAAILGH